MNTWCFEVNFYWSIFLPRRAESRQRYSCRAVRGVVAIIVMDKLCCNNCNHPISSHEDLAFYKESETQVHLITKPERNETVKHLETRVKEKKVNSLVITTDITE